MYSKILVPLDESKLAEMALPYARLLARRLEIPVELLTVIDTTLVDSHVLGGKSRLLDSLVGESVKNSREYLSGIAETFGGAEVKCSAQNGPTAELIIHKAKAEAATLIAMTTHGRSGINRFLLGSVAEKVLRGTANQLLLVRSTKDAKTEGEAMLKSIVVPLDGSELAESVLPAVVEMAGKLSLEVILFRAFEIPYGLYAAANGYYAINFDKFIAETKAEINIYLETKCEELRRQGIEKVSSVSMEGLSADQIISFARNTPDNLVAMCSHGRSGLKRWALGSVTETVVRYSGDPVLVLRAGT